MKKIPMILLVIAPYTLVAFMFYSVSYNTNIRAALIVYIAILLLNMGYAFLLPWMGFGGKEILFWNMLLKLCHIPVYLGVMFFVLLIWAWTLRPFSWQSMSTTKDANTATEGNAPKPR